MDEGALPRRRCAHEGGGQRPRTWGTFEQAIARAAEVQGIGWVFSTDDPYCGVDLDGCVDVRTGELHQAAAEILERLGGYQEHSPSGAGMHAIVAGELRGDRHRTADTPWGGIFEVYDRGRFFTVTGDGGGAIVDRQGELDELVERMLGEASRNGTGPGSGDDRSVDNLLAEFPKLKQIMLHKGRAPKDPTPSGWDYYLACKSVRCGLSDGEIEALIRRGRPGDPKVDRHDYIRRTIGRARTATKDEAASQADPAQYLSARYSVEGDPIVGGRLIGRGEDAIVRLRRRSNRELRLGHLSQLFSARTHNRVVSVATRTRFAPVTDKEAIDLAQRVIELCEFTEFDERDVAEQWVSDFISRTGDVVDAIDGEGNRLDVWDVLLAREVAEGRDELRHAADVAGRTAIVRGHDGRLWIPAGPLRASISPGAPKWGELEGELTDIGWVRKKVEMWTPKVKRGAPGSRHIKTIFYVSPEPETGQRRRRANRLTVTGSRSSWRRDRRLSTRVH